MSTKRDLLDTLRAEGLLEYGSNIPREIVREVLMLEYPTMGTQAEFASLSLRELAGVDYVRNHLLGEGKYLANDKGDYRVVLPSENARRVELYINSADKKLRRALKLSRNTPKGDYPSPDSKSARVIVKRESLRREKARNSLVQ